MPFKKSKQLFYILSVGGIYMSFTSGKLHYTVLREVKQKRKKYILVMLLKLMFGLTSWTNWYPQVSLNHTLRINA